MNKKIIFVFILASLILIAGCKGRQEERPITDVDIRKGTDGLDMAFIESAPPESVFEDGVFPIAVNLKNKGAFHIVDDKDTPEIEKGILVFGFEKAYVGVSEVDLKKIILNKFEDLPPEDLEDLSSKELEGLLLKKLEELPVEELERLVLDELGRVPADALKDLSNEEKAKYWKQFNSALANLEERKIYNIKGKSISNPSGDEEFITIDAQAKKIGTQSETHPSTILATACYPYKTIFGSSVCIDTDIYGMRKGEKACSIEDLKFSEGQGAPVTITKIETRMLPQDEEKIKPHFIIYIENKGNGEVVNLSKVERACSSEPLEYKDFNTLIIKVSLSGMPLDCGGDKIDLTSTMVRLREKEDMVRCTLEEGIDIGRDAYIAPLSIELDYGYTFTISKDIIIEKVLTY